MNNNHPHTESKKSTCSYCGVGCGVVIHKEHNGKVLVEGDKDHPANKGMLCSKGMNLHYTVMDQSDRLLHPQMRWARNQPLQQVSWDTALDRAAAVFKTLIKKYGPDSVGLYVSGQLLTEEYYVANKLTKGFLQTNNIDTNSRLCMSSAVAGYKQAFGEDSVPISYDDIELADCFLIAGANPAWCHPILFRRLEAHKAANPDTKIIVVDPRKTQSCSIADIHLQINPGTDITLFHAIGRYLIEQNLIDEDFIVDHTDGFDVYREKVMQRTITEAAKICGVSVEDIKATARYIGRSKGYISMWAMGLNQSVVGVNKNMALLVLSLITGQIGKPGAGPFSLTGQPNAMGGREVGGLSNLLAAHKNLNNPIHRKEVAKFWGVDHINPQPGLSATEMVEALESGNMKAIWVICTNPIVSLPDARKVEAALKKAKFVIVQDISNKSNTVDFADLVLPAAGYMEKEGTMTNSDRRISYLNKVVDAPGEALPDAEIICRFAQKMGFEDAFAFSNYGEIFDEHCKLTKGTNIDISGLNYDILRKKGTVQWPFPDRKSEGTKRLFTDHQFYTDNQRAKILPVDDANQSEGTSPDYPLILTTGRIRDQWHTMTKTGKVNKLKQHISKPYLEIHPDDATARNIKEGDAVEINSLRGNVRVTAKITDTIKQGVVFLPMHWGRLSGKDFGRANNVTSNLVDPTSKEPDFKFSAVQVTPFRRNHQKIIVVGAGAGAYGFVIKYREFNQDDEIVVFSKEEHPFYNRVMLPEYVSGKQNWEQLVKMQKAEFASLKIAVHRGIGVDQVDTANKTITDSEGNKHSYDKLLLATGSRAFRPDSIPQMGGIFTMRNRFDADELVKKLKGSKKKVVVVGGGLLGLEMADSLHEIGQDISIIQRAPRLMERQLDELAGNLLDEELRERGIDIYYNDEVTSFRGEENIRCIGLKSGRFIDCDIMIVAIGTTPNIEYLKGSGLQLKRGVVVNDYLQTSNKDIFAIGEIAEHNHFLYGITAAAEEQAEIVAKYMAGDLTTHYEGSILMNILKVSGLQLSSIGLSEIPANGQGYEEVLFVDKSKRYYKKCIIHHDKLVGTILLGDKSEFNEYRELIKNKTELGNKREALLRSAGEAPKVIGKLVCSCNNVGEGNIEAAIKDGCKDLTEVCQKTGAGTGCGSCKPEVKSMLEKLAEVTA